MSVTAFTGMTLLWITTHQKMVRSQQVMYILHSPTRLNQSACSVHYKTALIYCLAMRYECRIEGRDRFLAADLGLIVS